MKKIKIITLTTIVSLSLFACKKKQEDTPPQPIVGFWKGNYGNGAGTANNYYAALIRANGTIRMYGNGTDTSTADKAEGTYQFNNNIITATYEYFSGGQFSISATMTNSNRLDGTWGSNTNTTNGGTWYMDKQ